MVGERERRRYGDSTERFGRITRPVFARDGTQVYLAADLCASVDGSGEGAFSGARDIRAGVASRQVLRP